MSAIDKDQPLTNVEPVDYSIARFVAAGPKFNVVLFGTFGVLGLALVCVGIYGVIANAVTRQTREIGVRIALGATLVDVIRLVVGRAARLIGIGLVLGFAGALAAARYVSSILQGVPSHDASSSVSMAVLLAAVGFLASWLPARRAARMQPMRALRAE
jgi:ABC-type antimicrobial peptide transport system permease subunit